MSEPKINPEWEALEGKPHLVPLNCVPDQYKVIKVGRQPTDDEILQRLRDSDYGRKLTRDDSCPNSIVDVDSV